MSDDDESCCVCCMSCPRAVRTQPCGHAVYCELCTIRAVQASGLKCGVCRCAVQRLVVVPVNPAGDPPHLRSMQTYQAEPETEGSVFESVDAFLQAKLGGDDAEVAEAATAALARVSRHGEEEEEEEVEENPLFRIDAQGHATVPEGETELPENAFMSCRSLISITLPASLTSIGDRAFENCTSLAPTKLPDGLTSIDDYAFYGCGSLALASLPDGLTSIGDRAFRGCASLGPYLNWHTF